MAEDKKENKKEKENKRKKSGKSESVCERVKIHVEAPVSTYTAENPNKSKQTSSIQKQTETLVDPGISSPPILSGARSTTVTTAVRNIAPQPTMTVAGNHSKSPQTSTTPAATHSQSQLTNGAQTVQKQVSKLRTFFSNLIKLASERKSPDIGKTVKDLVESLKDERLTEEQFAANLQKTLNSPPQPNLVGFLKRTLPLLREQSRSQSTVPQLIGHQKTKRLSQPLEGQLQNKSPTPAIFRQTQGTTATTGITPGSQVVTSTPKVLYPGPRLFTSTVNMPSTVPKSIGHKNTLSQPHQGQLQNKSPTPAIFPQTQGITTATTGRTPGSQVVASTPKVLYPPVFTAAEKVAACTKSHSATPSTLGAADKLKPKGVSGASRNADLVYRSCSSGSDNNNVTSAEEVHPMAHQEKEEVARKRVVNTAMLSAIGSTKKRKLDNALEGSSTPKADERVGSVTATKETSGKQMTIYQHKLNTGSLSSVGPLLKHQVHSRGIGHKPTDLQEQLKRKEEHTANIQFRVLEEQNDNLQRQLKKAQQQLAEKTGKEDNLRRRMSEMDQEMRDVQAQLQKKELDEVKLVREREQQQKKSRIKLHKMEKQLTNAQERLQEKVSQEANLQEQLREKEQRNETLQRQMSQKEQQLSSVQQQLLEKDLQEANLQMQFEEKKRQLFKSEGQLRKLKQQLTIIRGQFRKKLLHKATLQGQLRRKDQQLVNSERQLREVRQQLINTQGQLREKTEETVILQNQVTDLQGQLRIKDRAMNELQVTLSTAQQTLSEYQRQQSPDWVISRDEIQLTGNVLGRGAWGSVFEGKYCGCSVAVKQIHDLILSDHNRRLFEREMDIASRCRHPCLLQFIGATNDEGSPLFVTELMETSLRALLRQRSLRETEIPVISLDVARALNYLHRKEPSPIIHRDVSSANVLLWQRGNQWRAKVGDYGTANFMQHTMTVAPGAPIYSAPEALTTNQTVKVDVYSFGILLCEMCIGELPLPDRRNEQVAMVTNRTLRVLIRGCLETAPEMRSSMDEVIRELQQSV